MAIRLYHVLPSLPIHGAFTVSHFLERCAGTPGVFSSRSPSCAVTTSSTVWGALSCYLMFSSL